MVRIRAQELLRRGGTEKDCAALRKNDPGKPAIGARVRKETTLPIQWIGRALAAWHGQERPDDALPMDAKPSETSQTNQSPQLEFQTMGDPFPAEPFPFSF